MKKELEDAFDIVIDLDPDRPLDIDSNGEWMVDTDRYEETGELYAMVQGAKGDIDIDQTPLAISIKTRTDLDAFTSQIMYAIELELAKWTKEDWSDPIADAIVKAEKFYRA